MYTVLTLLFFFFYTHTHTCYHPSVYPPTTDVELHSNPFYTQQKGGKQDTTFRAGGSSASGRSGESGGGASPGGATAESGEVSMSTANPMYLRSSEGLPTSVPSTTAPPTFAPPTTLPPTTATSSTVPPTTIPPSAVPSRSTDHPTTRRFDRPGSEAGGGPGPGPGRGPGGANG